MAMNAIDAAGSKGFGVASGDAGAIVGAVEQSATQAKAETYPSPPRPRAGLIDAPDAPGPKLPPPAERAAGGSPNTVPASGGKDLAHAITALYGLKPASGERNLTAEQVADGLCLQGSARAEFMGRRFASCVIHADGSLDLKLKGQGPLVWQVELGGHIHTNMLGPTLTAKASEMELNVSSGWQVEVVGINVNVERVAINKEKTHVKVRGTWGIFWRTLLVPID